MKFRLGLPLIFLAVCAEAQTLSVNYLRGAADYSGWKLWTWNETDKGHGFDAAGKTENGALVFSLDLEKLGLNGKKIGFLPKLGDWQDKDSPDRYYEPGMPMKIYLTENDAKIYSEPPQAKPELTAAFLDAPGKIRAVLSAGIAKDFPKNGFTVETEKGQAEISGCEISGGAGKIVLISLKSAGWPDMSSVNRGLWKVKSAQFGQAVIWPGKILDEPQFISDKEMGIVREGTSTIARVFAPTAVGAAVLLKTDEASPETGEIAMRPAGNGLWEAALPQNPEGLLYRVKATRNGETVEAIDPYARATTAHNGWGIITKDETPIAPPPVFDFSRAVIYELHLRDFNINKNSGVKLKGKYLGLAEEGTRHPLYPEIKTGLDHLLELGINAVHIMPFQDFENDESSHIYNWGYMPVHFNAPDGWYAAEPRSSSKIGEVKRMISALHKKGIKAIMDVVYNHTAETSPKNVFSFNALAPGYYYRLKDDGTYSNGSGCGNEFRTESPMGRKFILDSLAYWVKDYKVDGFRFDLMGLIDLETITRAAARLRQLNPEIIIYGEPWTAGATTIKKTEKGDQRSRGFSVFNDNFRDAIKGSVFNLLPGYVQAGKNRDEVKTGIAGSVDDFTDSPLETINYVSCHDNLTLWDRLVLSTTGQTPAEQEAMDKLANGIILTSQGVPFIHSGEEFLRTKNGEDNSYNLPDSVNEIDWSRKKEHYGIFSYYRDMIALRKNHPAFTMRTADGVRKNLKFYEELKLPVKSPAIAYVLDGKAAGDDWDEIVVLINPARKKMKLALPKGKFELAADGSGLIPAGKHIICEGKIAVEPLSLVVLRRIK